MTNRLRPHRFREGIALATLGAYLAGLAPAAAAAVTPTPPPEKLPQSRLTIDHDPLACVTTELAPQVDAAVAPAPVFDHGYVYFKAAGTEDFYYATMKGAPANLSGVLPRPLPETRAIDYYLRATDLDSLARKTRDYVPPVVPGNACKAKGVAVGEKGAGLTIGLTREGQAPVPPGFNRKDIAFVILFGGAVVGIAEALKGGTAGSAGSSSAGSAGKASGAGSGGGLSTGVIVAGAAVAAGGIAAVVVSNNKSNNSPSRTPTPTMTPTPTATPTVSSFRFVQAEVTWTGEGDLDIQILNASNQVVGQPFPAGCESTATRTERALLQGSALVSGQYRIVLIGKACTTGTPASITAVVTVQTESGPKCASTFINVPVPGTINGCSFTIP